MFGRDFMTGDCNHKFQPRYSDVDPQWVSEAIRAGVTTKGRFTKDRVYECDVCVRCGKVVKK